MVFERILTLKKNRTSNITMPTMQIFFNVHYRMQYNARALRTSRLGPYYLGYTVLMKLVSPF